MNLEERLDALIAWFEEPASAGLDSEAARRVRGDKQPQQTGGEASGDTGEETAADFGLSAFPDPEEEPAVKTRGQLQTEYDIAGLRGDAFGQSSQTRILEEELPRVEQSWQTRKPVMMEPGQLDMYLRSSWQTLSERQRAEMTALQQCGMVPDREMDLFLYTLSLMNTLASRKELTRLLEQLEPRAAVSESWKALTDALRCRISAMEAIKARRIRDAEEQLRIREEAFRAASMEYERAKAERIRVQNSDL